MRTLDDEELDSGDDEERDDRGQADDLNNEDELLLTSGDFVLSRVQIPESSDGEVSQCADHIPSILMMESSSTPSRFLISSRFSPKTSSLLRTTHLRSLQPLSPFTGDTTQKSKINSSQMHVFSGGQTGP